MKVLHEAGADLNWAPKGYDNSLGLAVHYLSYDAAEFLIKNGVNLQWTATNYPYTAYETAVIRKKYKMANLIKGVESIEPLRSIEHNKLDDQTRWNIERDENTKLIVDHFIDSIWNKPVNEIFNGLKTDTKDRKNYERAKHAKAIKKPFTYERIPVKIRDCHLGNEAPHISSYIHATGYGSSSAELTLNGHIGFFHPRRVMDPVTKSYNCLEQDLNTTKNTITGGLFYSSYSKAHDEYLAKFYMTANSISEFRRMLIEKNVPLEWCYIINAPKRYNGYRTKLGCFVDWWQVNISGMIFEINPSIEIVMEGNLLVSFKLNRLTIKKSQQHLSLSQIYRQKTQDKAYWDMVKGFSELGLHRARHFIRQERQEATAQAASNKAYHQAIKNKFDRMESANKIPSYKPTTPGFVNKPYSMPKVNATKPGSTVKNSNKNAPSSKQSSGSLSSIQVKCRKYLSHPSRGLYSDDSSYNTAVAKFKDDFSRFLKRQPQKCHREIREHSFCNLTNSCKQSKSGGSLK